MIKKKREEGRKRERRNGFSLRRTPPSIKTRRREKERVQSSHRTLPLCLICRSEIRSLMSRSLIMRRNGNSTKLLIRETLSPANSKSFKPTRTERSFTHLGSCSLPSKLRSRIRVRRDSLRFRFHFCSHFRLSTCVSYGTTMQTRRLGSLGERFWRFWLCRWIWVWSRVLWNGLYTRFRFPTEKNSEYKEKRDHKEPKKSSSPTNSNKTFPNPTNRTNKSRWGIYRGARGKRCRTPHDVNRITRPRPFSHRQPTVSLSNANPINQPRRRRKKTKREDMQSLQCV